MQVTILFVVLTHLVSPRFENNSFATRFTASAISLTKDRVTYDPSYYQIPYPNGDVPANKGVCADVIIRAYRKVGIDLQKLIHEDMVKNFSSYPKLWGLKNTDTNIDHRRVPNQMKFFSRFGIVKKKSLDVADYAPGDIVAWELDHGLTHVGIVINQRSNDNKRYLIVHNIGNGQEISDCLFSYKIIGHYLYTGK